MLSHNYICQDSVAGRILQTTRHQYMANDISLSNFVSLGIDVCPTDMVRILIILWRITTPIYTL